MKYEEEPCYLKIHSKITDTLKTCGYPNDENFKIVINLHKFCLFSIPTFYLKLSFDTKSSAAKSTIKSCYEDDDINIPVNRNIYTSDEDDDNLQVKNKLKTNSSNSF